MAEMVLADFEHQIPELTLIPGGGGVFEITVGDRLVYSKKATGQHPTYEEIQPQLHNLLK